MIEEFLRKFGMPTPAQPTLQEPSLAYHRLRLIQEEALEYEHALALAYLARSPEELEHAFEHMLDALCDLVYSAIGTALIHGFNFEAAMAEVHRANMDKQPGVGKRGHSCDVIKPEGWRPPQLRHMVKQPRPLVQTVGSIVRALPLAG